MSRARELSRLGNPNIISADSSFNVGFGTAEPKEKVNVVGVVSATSFFGDGSGLDGIASAGIGTALSDDKTKALNTIYFTNDEVLVTNNSVVNPPDSGHIAYTQAPTIVIEDTKELTVSDGDDLLVDVLGISTGTNVDYAARGNGVFGNIYVDNIESSGGQTSVNFPKGLVSTGVATFHSDVSIGGTLTYEDVKNIDSVGLITARTGVRISGGGIDIVGDIGLGAGAQTGTAGQLLTSGGAGANATWTTVNAAPSVSGISSGAIAAGKPVMMNEDGKLSAVNGVSSLKATTTPYVADTSADGAGLEYMSLVYDPVNDQYICVYHTSTGSPSHHIKAKVGQVSGTTITWGAAQTICAGNSDQPRALWDTVNNKLIVMYRATSDSNKGKCKVCSVSGTTITPGAESGDFTNGTELTRQTFVHDPVEDKIVFFWENNSAGKTRVGEVNPSNDTITFPGSQGEYCPSRAFIPVAIFVPGPNKVVVSFMHYTASEKGAIVAGTVSGNNVTFGTIQYYETAYQNGSGLSYDSVNSRVLISWACGSTGQNLPKARTATLSGTTFTFATTHNLQSPNGTQGSAQDPAICFDPTSKKALSIWTDTGNSNSQLVGTTLTINPLDGSLTQNTATQITTGQTIQIMGIDEGENLILDPDTGIIAYIWKDTNSSGQTPGIKYYTERLGSSNMNATNFVGFSQAAYTNGQTATVHVVGATNTNQTGLTTASRYYVAGDGTLSITAGDPSVDAGLALSDTSILIR